MVKLFMGFIFMVGIGVVYFLCIDSTVHNAKEISRLNKEHKEVMKEYEGDRK